VNDAKSNEETDNKRKEEIDTRNNADSIVYQTEKNIDQFKDKLDEDIIAKLNAALERTKKSIEDNNVPEMKTSSEDLQKIWYEASSKIYQDTASQQQGQPGAAPGGEPFNRGNGQKPEEDTDDAVDVISKLWMTIKSNMIDT